MLTNAHKGDRITVLDANTGKIVRLFNLRQQTWVEHFEWTLEGDRIVGRTSIGRATVIALQLNRPSLVRARRAWSASGGIRRRRSIQLAGSATAPGGAQGPDAPDLIGLKVFPLVRPDRSRDQKVGSAASRRRVEQLAVELEREALDVFRVARKLESGLPLVLNLEERTVTHGRASVVARLRDFTRRYVDLAGLDALDERIGQGTASWYRQGGLLLDAAERVRG